MNSSKTTNNNILYFNWFKAAQKTTKQGKLVFYGPSPHTFNRKEIQKKEGITWDLINRIWIIFDPVEKKYTKYYKLLAIECYDVETIDKGEPIGLIAEKLII